MSAEQRRTLLRRAFAGDFEDWSGLPAGCTAEDFATLSSGESANGVGRISGLPTAFRDYAGHPGPLRVFFDDDDHAFLVWADWTPAGGNGTDALAVLGPLSTALNDLPSRRPGTTQHIWGSSGVVAYIAQDGSVRGLALFAPASPEYYSSLLGGNESPPYRPLPRK